MLGVLVVISGCLAPVGPAPSYGGFPPEAVVRAMDGVAAIVHEEADRLICAGAWVSASHIVTAAHCAQSSVLVATRADWERDPQILMPTRCLHYSAEQDIAILEIASASKRPHEILTLSQRRILPGSPVLAIGHPAGLSWTVGAGVVAHDGLRTHDGATWLQASLELYYGNSGGPLVDDRGEIVGIASHFIRASHLGMFAPAGAVRASWRMMNGCAARPYQEPVG